MTEYPPEHERTEKMTDHPILFQSDMVLAIMDGRKTQARRVIKPQPVLVQHEDEGGHIEWSCPKWPNLQVDGVEDLAAYLKYQPGDLLYVRETWLLNCSGSDESLRVQYRASDDDYRPDDERFIGRLVKIHATEYMGAAKEMWKKHYRRVKGYDISWKPPIHMPKWACRNWLKTTGNRVERVQDISHDDILAEGVSAQFTFGRYATSPRGGWSAAQRWDIFQCLWDSINAKPKPRYHKKVITHYESYPWEAGRETLEHRGKRWEVYGNPWVTVTEFERTER